MSYSPTRKTFALHQVDSWSIGTSPLTALMSILIGMIGLLRGKRK